MERSWRWKSTAGLADSLLAIRSPPAGDHARVRPLVAELAQLVPETVGSQAPVAACLTALRRLEEDMLNLLRETAETVLGKHTLVQRGFVISCQPVKSHPIAFQGIFFGNKSLSCS